MYERGKRITSILLLLLLLMMLIPVQALAVEEGSEVGAETSAPMEEVVGGLQEMPTEEMPIEAIPEAEETAEEIISEEAPASPSEDIPEELSVSAVEVVEEKGTVPDWFTADSDELFTAYFFEQSGLNGSAAENSFPLYNTVAVPAAARDTYNAVLAAVQEIAAGKQSSTKVYADGAYYNHATVVSSLLANASQYLYWFDKVYGWGYGIDGGGQFIIFNVSVNYMGEDDTHVDTAKIAAANTAISNAQGIVEKISSSSDYVKLEYYKDQICYLTDYNYDAASRPYASRVQLPGPYGIDPWQLVWVFDGDPDTMVVCEGYSKAFKYLCDLTAASGYWINSTIDCSLVTGAIPEGAHMWNLIHVNGTDNYLVDVTNCDSGHELFLRGSKSGNYNSSYTFAGITFCYDSDTINSYGAGALTLAAADATETSLLSLAAPVCNATDDGFMALNVHRIVANVSDAARVQFAVWSDAELAESHWYDASRSGNDYIFDVDLAAHGTYAGIYHFSVYAWDGRNVPHALGSASFTVPAEQLFFPPQSNGFAHGYMEPGVHRVVVNMDNATAVRFGVWVDGEAVPHWYPATQVGKDFYADVPLANHGSHVGGYNVHAYATGLDGNEYPVAATVIPVEAWEIVPAPQANGFAHGYMEPGVHRVVVNMDNATAVRFGVWVDGEAEAHWYPATQVGKDFYADVPLANHGSHVGGYNVHAYATGLDGNEYPVAATVIPVEAWEIVPAPQANGFAHGYMEPGVHRVVVNMDNATAVRFGVWVDGEAEAHWYTATQVGKDFYADFSLANHGSHVGGYNVHAYATGLDGNEYPVAATVIPVEAWEIIG